MMMPIGYFPRSGNNDKSISQQLEWQEGYADIKIKMIIRDTLWHEKSAAADTKHS